MDGEMVFDAIRGWFYLSVALIIYGGVTEGAQLAIKIAGIVALIPIAAFLLWGILWLFRCALELLIYNT